MSPASVDNTHPVVFQTTHWRARSITSKEGAIHYGRTSGWCTAIRANLDYERVYNPTLGQLYIIWKRGKHRPWAQFFISFQGGSEFQLRGCRSTCEDEILGMPGGRDLLDWINGIAKRPVLRKESGGFDLSIAARQYNSRLMTVMTHALQGEVYLDRYAGPVTVGDPNHPLADLYATPFTQHVILPNLAHGLARQIIPALYGKPSEKDEHRPAIEREAHNILVDMRRMIAGPTNRVPGLYLGLDTTYQDRNREEFVYYARINRRAVPLGLDIPNRYINEDVALGMTVPRSIVLDVETNYIATRQQIFSTEVRFS